jgi:hypothetical protein
MREFFRKFRRPRKPVPAQPISLHPLWSFGGSLDGGTLSPASVLKSLVDLLPDGWR